MHANEYSHLRPHVDTQKWTRYPHSHSPYALYTPRSRHHHPQRGSQRPIPELNPLRSGVGTGDHPGPRSSRENQQPDPDRAASSSSQPPAPDREQRTGVWEKRPHASPHLLKCSVGVCCSRCFKTGGFKTGEGHPPQACVSSSPP